MSQRREDPNPVTLEERYAAASSTSDLGLPHGDGAGAQGILAAAAWTEVHLGSALRRLRDQWEREKPVRRQPRTREQLIAAGIPAKVARAEHRRQEQNLAVAYARQLLAVMRHLREWPAAHEALTLYASGLGLEDADSLAFTVLRRWLRDPRNPLTAPNERRLWAYLDECLNAARFGLRQGMRGRTNNHPE